jgi:hypothetical protein
MARAEMNSWGEYDVMRKSLFLVLLLLAACASRMPPVSETHDSGGNVHPAQTEQSSSGQRLRVLFIGNSFTYVNDLPRLTERLATSANESRPLETRMVTVGGASLKSHWDNGEALAAIKGARWDYVVLQEQSALPINNPKVMHEYARLFDAEIRKAGARTIFYLTWAREDRPEAQAAITAAYTSIADELGALLAPVGLAWQRALKEKDGLRLYHKDKLHSSPAGTYMAACVFYAVLYGKSPEGLARRLIDSQFGTDSEGANLDLDNLGEADARLIQRIAWQTVQETERSKPAQQRQAA